MKPRVLILSGMWPTDRNTISGIFIAEQINALCDQGCNVAILSCRQLGKRARPSSSQELGLDPEQVDLVIVPVLRLPEFLSRSRLALRLNIKLSGMILQAAINSHLQNHGQPDGCIVHNIRYAGLSLGSWGKRISPEKLLYIHGVDPFLLRRDLRQLARRLLRAFPERSVIT